VAKLKFQTPETFFVGYLQLGVEKLQLRAFLLTFVNPHDAAASNAKQIHAKDVSDVAYTQRLQSTQKPKRKERTNNVVCLLALCSIIVLSERKQRLTFPRFLTRLFALDV